MGPLPLGGGAGKVAPRLGGRSALQAVRCSGGRLLRGALCCCAALPHAGLCLSGSHPSLCPAVLSRVRLFFPPGHWSAPLPASTLSMAEVLILAWRGGIAQSLGTCLPTRAAPRPL